MTQNIADTKLIEGILWDVEAGLQTNDLQGLCRPLELAANHLERAKADMPSDTFRRLQERYCSLMSEYEFASSINPERFKELANENSLYYTFSYEEINSQDSN